jgi:hypothetical protein
MPRPLLIAVVLFASSAAAQDQALTPTALVAEPVPEPTAAVEPSKPVVPLQPTALQLRGGTVGIGYLGLISMAPPSFGLGGMGGLFGLSALRTQAPVLGARWWLKNSRLGIDLGLGVMVSATDMTQGVAVGSPSVQLVGLVGLPIAIVSTQHVIVLAGPEFRAGYSWLDQSSINSLSSSLLELSARGAIELFFSFIGVPALSVEVAIRVGVSREAQGFSTVAALTPGQESTLITQTFRFSTSLSGDALSVVASTLALKYYF